MYRNPIGEVYKSRWSEVRVFVWCVIVSLVLPGCAEGEGCETWYKSGVISAGLMSESFVFLLLSLRAMIMTRLTIPMEGMASHVKLSDCTLR